MRILLTKVSGRLHRETRTLEAIKKRLKEMCAEMNSHVTICPIKEKQIMIREGVPFDEILKTVQQVGAALIVVGTHGYGMVQDLLLGGTARRQVRKSKNPVLVVPCS